MTTDVTRGKNSARCGYAAADPRDSLAALRQHIGLAEGHLAALHGLLRHLEECFDHGPEHDRAA